MLGWSINLFRIRGIRIALHFTFPFLLAWACLEGWQADGWEGLFWSGVTILAFFSCVVLHELGHSLTAMRFGVKVRRILLMPIGGMAEFDRIPRMPSQELLITIAGPLVNFAIAAVLWCVVDFPEGWNTDTGGFSVADLGRTLVTWNVYVGLFNLIPAFPMDGGRILRALLALRMPYLKATFWAVNMAKVLTICGAIGAIYLQHYLVAALCAFVYVAGEAEYRSVRRRELEEAQWRDALTAPMVQPPVDEPPLLNG